MIGNCSFIIVFANRRNFWERKHENKEILLFIVFLLLFFFLLLFSSIIVFGFLIFVFFQKFNFYNGTIILHENLILACFFVTYINNIRILYLLYTFIIIYLVLISER